MTDAEEKAQKRYWMSLSLGQMRRDLKDTRRTAKEWAEDAQAQAARINKLKIKARELDIDLD